MYLKGFSDGGDELCDRFDRMLGLYYVGEQYGGCGSILDRLMHRSAIKPGAMWRGNLDREEDSQARYYAARYLSAPPAVAS